MSAGLDEGGVKRALREKESELIACYEKQLLTNPSLAGTVEAKLTFADDGAVSGATADGIGDSRLEECVQGVLKALSVRRVKGGTAAFRIEFAVK